MQILRRQFLSNVGQTSPSPMLIEVNEYNHGFLHFLIGICSIVGGIFTVFQIIDSFLFESIHTLKKKTELGKDV